MTIPIGCSICYEPIQDLVVCKSNHPFDRKCLKIWSSAAGTRPKNQCAICTQRFLKVENWTAAARDLQTQCTLYKNDHPQLTSHTDMDAVPDDSEVTFYSIALALAFAIKIVWAHNHH